MAQDSIMKAMMKAKRIFTPSGFYFLPDDDPRPDMDFFRGLLASNQYMPGGKKATGDKKPTEEWKKIRAEVNLTIVFEGIWYFADFWNTKSFCRRLSGSLNYGTKHGPKLRAMVDAYCDARSAFLQLQQQGQEAVPAPGSRLVELADHVNELREQPNPSSNVRITTKVWTRRTEGWKRRLQEVMAELEVLNASQLKEDQASPTSPVPSHAAGIDPNGKHPVSNGNGAGDKPDNASKESTPFFFDVSGKKGKISGTKRGPPDDADGDANNFGNSPKRRALEKYLPSSDEESDARSAKLVLRDDSIDRSQEMKLDHELWMGEIEARQKEMEEGMNQKLDIQTKEATARLEAFQAQLRAMQDQLQEHRTTAAALPNLPAASADPKERGPSELTAREPKEFIKAICEELNTLRTVTKAKIHQMDRQGIPDDEEKLAISDLSWQIGKCIKVAKRGVGKLM
ncbi:hypothetical protein PG993_010457 [Apiospora rasikravindrae]|uniref:Uncharacterized protein n=1 Tax=Apiospora rasikravindrae TaxID=990691 RepID=A0ABR1SM97_9PEZI